MRRGAGHRAGLYLIAVCAVLAALASAAAEAFPLESPATGPGLRPQLPAAAAPDVGAALADAGIEPAPPEVVSEPAGAEQALAARSRTWPNAEPARKPSAGPTARERGRAEAGRRGTEARKRRGAPDFVPNEVIVRFAPGVGDAEADAIVGRRGHSIERKLRLPRSAVVRTRPGASVEAVAKALSRERGVLYAEPNFLRRVSVVPSDPDFGSLWGLDNLGDADIDAPEAWEVSTGSAAVTVAVVDTGVAYDHPDLAANMWANPGELAANGLDDDGNGFIDDVRGWDFVDADADPRDYDGHGTHVAGTIGAEGDNATGVTGVGWTTTLMPLRVCGPFGCSDAAIVDAFGYAAANGADVVNGSFGGPGFSQSILDAINAAPNVLFVIAAGNDDTDNDVAPHYPCAYPDGATTDTNTAGNIVCVAASTGNELAAGFSNWGATSVDLFAPGEGILSTVPDRDVVAFNDFDTAGDQFTSGGTNDTWAETTTFPPLEAFPLGTVLTDSPGGNYANNTASWAQVLGPVSTSGLQGCEAPYFISFDLGPFGGPGPGDTLMPQTSTDGVTWTDVPLGFWAGDSQGWFVFREPLDVDDQPTVYLRFLLDTSATDAFDGVYLDNISIQCVGTTYDGDEYDWLSGTSMATPHVAGAAAVVLARAAALGIPVTVPELKHLLLESVDPEPAYTGLVVSDGRLNLFKAVRGFCQGQPATHVAVDGNNAIVGTSGADVIVAFEGNDVIGGGGGVDRICSGGGGDQVSGGPGNDQLNGGEGDDHLAGNAGDDVLDGGLGVDLVYFGTATGPVTATMTSALGEGSDTLSGFEGLVGGPFGDSLTGDGSPNILRGEGGPDTLSGGGGPDTLLGGAGDDTLLDGGEGNDVVRGGDGVDVLVGGAGNDQLYGEDGGDDLAGSEGHDALFGGPGDDTLGGGPGFDALSGGTGADALNGGGGDDHMAGNEDDDTLDGMLGSDLAYWGTATGPITATMTAATGEGSDTMAGLEGLVGGPLDDSLTGDGGANILRGAAGADSLVGGAGNDLVDGGDGSDPLLDGGDGNDVVRGGDGVDLLLGGTGNDQLFGQAGDDGGPAGGLEGGDGHDLLDGGTGNDELLGGEGDDWLQSGPGDDFFDGGPGRDTLSFASSPFPVLASLLAGTATGEGSDVLAMIEIVYGSAGDDSLTGSAAGDQLFGLAGDDSLSGLEGADYLDGGAGTDTIDGGTDGNFDQCLNGESLTNCP